MCVLLGGVIASLAVGPLVTSVPGLGEFGLVGWKLSPTFGFRVQSSKDVRGLIGLADTCLLGLVLMNIEL